MYNLIIKKQAKKRLQALAASTRVKVAGAINMLGKNPDDERLDIKKMKGKPTYRLRVGQWRVIFERDDDVRILSIEKIGARGDIYK